MAEWVNEYAKPDQTFMANEFGTVGYLTRHRMIDPFGLINWTNNYPKLRTTRKFRKTHKRYREIVSRFEPDLILLDSAAEGLNIEQAGIYKVVKEFEWGILGSTIAIRSPTVLKDPNAYTKLREALPADRGRNIPILRYANP